MKPQEYRAVAGRIAAKGLTPEGKLLRQVERLIQLMPCVEWYCRMNTGQAVFGGRRVRFGYPGMADFYVRLIKRNGLSRTVWLELKAPEGRQSDAQITFQHEVEGLGDWYFIVRSPEEAQVRLQMAFARE